MVRLVSRVYSPVSQALRFTSNAVGSVTNTARNIVQRSIKAVNGLGNSASRRVNKAVTNMTRRKRQNRRSTRKQQRKTRQERR